MGLGDYLRVGSSETSIQNEDLFQFENVVFRPSYNGMALARW